MAPGASRQFEGGPVRPSRSFALGEAQPALLHRSSEGCFRSRWQVARLAIRPNHMLAAGRSNTNGRGQTLAISRPCLRSV
eukprot:2462326-Pyramimonas_sp.AAC.2